MVKKKPNILVVNDDGITAPGIKVLLEEMQKNWQCGCCGTRFGTIGYGACDYAW